MGLFNKNRSKDEVIKNEISKASEILYNIGDKLDLYPEYTDRYLYTQQQLENLTNKNATLEDIQGLLENLKHLQLDIESKELLN